MFEYETKFVLTDEHEQLRQKLVRDVVPKEIIQLYLISESHQSARIRHVKFGHIVKYVFTYKKQIDQKTIEISKDISKNDYDYLSQDYKTKLTKFRYIVNPIHSENHSPDKKFVFEIDVFEKHNLCYLIMMEAEVPTDEEGNPKISIEEVEARMPDWIKKHVIFRISQTDMRFRRFQNSHLSSRTYVADVLQSLPTCPEY